MLWVTSPVRFAPCRVEATVAEVFETLRVYAGEKGITLTSESLDTLPSIEADERRLFNALYNLINNAIPEISFGGSVTVRGSVADDEQSVSISVIDTGRGMPPEIRDSLFTDAAVSSKRSGTGLGTKIVKDVVDAHGGTVTVESEEGVGSAFHVRLPIRQDR